MKRSPEQIDAAKSLMIAAGLVVLFHSGAIAWTVIVAVVVLKILGIL